MDKQNISLLAEASTRFNAEKASALTGDTFSGLTVFEPDSRRRDGPGSDELSFERADGDSNYYDFTNHLAQERLKGHRVQV